MTSFTSLSAFHELCAKPLSPIKEHQFHSYREIPSPLCKTAMWWEAQLTVTTTLVPAYTETITVYASTKKEVRQVLAKEMLLLIDDMVNPLQNTTQHIKHVKLAPATPLPSKTEMVLREFQKLVTDEDRSEEKFRRMEKWLKENSDLATLRERKFSQHKQPF